MALVSGPTLGAALANKKSSIQDVARKAKDDASLIDELFVRILNRPATPAEIESASGVIKQIEADHEKLVAVLAEQEAWWAKEKPIREATAKAELVETTRQLEAREAEIKPQREADEKARLGRVAKATKAVEEFEKTLPAKFDAFLKKNNNRVLWHLLPATALTGPPATTFTQRTDRSILVTGKGSKGIYSIDTKGPRSLITAVRLEALPDAQLPKSGPGLSSNGNFVVTEFELYVVKGGNKDEMRKIKLAKAFTDF